MRDWPDPHEPDGIGFGSKVVIVCCALFTALMYASIGYGLYSLIAG
jgi:hypothetical protein